MDGNLGRKQRAAYLGCKTSSPQTSSLPSTASLQANGVDSSRRRHCLGPNIWSSFKKKLHSKHFSFFCTSEQRDERHQPVLLDHLVEFVAQVVVGVGFQGVFDQDPARHEKVVQPVRDVEDYSGWRQRKRSRRWRFIREQQVRVMEGVGSRQKTAPTKVSGQQAQELFSLSCHHESTTPLLGGGGHRGA